MYQFCRPTGWKPDLVEHTSDVESFSTSKFGSSSSGVTTLPRETDGEIQKLWTVRDQKTTSECVLFAATGAIHARLRYLGYNPPLFSPQLPYKVARMLARLDKSIKLRDDGCYPVFAMKGISQYGIPLESEHPFDPATVNVEPDFQTFANASRFRLQTFSKIRESGEARVRAVMRCLAEHEPVICGLQIGERFDKYRAGSKPLTIETDDTAGHMVSICEYHSDGDLFTIANSWGDDWGDGGFGVVTREWIADASTTDFYNMTVVEI